MEDINAEAGQWYINIETEFTDTVWQEDTAMRLFQYTCSVGERAAQRLCNAQKFQEDQYTHLISAAGFGLQPSEPAGLYQVVYMQAYQTDKAIVYHPSGTSFAKFITTQQATAGFPPEYCIELNAVYKMHGTR
ncbi:hypothetical protein HGRIS_004301 [Hohenbuehelia grisea]|uniref:Uncharacterized protein n=1 Tax=Hohenbuehelia grisea TaxID=104357 RepID=A0ABR3IPI7_9AGAR